MIEDDLAAPGIVARAVLDAFAEELRNAPDWRELCTNSIHEHAQEERPQAVEPG